MKIIPMVPACQNIAELNKLAGLINECVHPEMVILFGYYAGMQMACTYHGYELLILTKDVPVMTYREVLNYLNQHFNPEERAEKHLSVYLFTAGFVQQMTSRSYFLMSIRKDGILLYRKADCKMSEHIKWKPTYAAKRLKTYTEHSLNMAKALLEDARRNYEMQIYRLAAFHLYQAAKEFTNASSFAQYGFLPEKQTDLFSAYLYIRQCSAEFTTLWNIPQDETGIALLRRLNGYKKYISVEYTHVSPEGLPLCLEKVEQFKLLAEHFCAEKIQLTENLPTI